MHTSFALHPHKCTGSIVGELKRSDLSPILLNNPTAHIVLQKFWTDVTPLMLIAEALRWV